MICDRLVFLLFKLPLVNVSTFLKCPKIVNCNLEMGSINQINIIFFWKTACFRILPISVVVFLATWLTHHTLVLQHIILHCLHCPGSAERKLTLD